MKSTSSQLVQIAVDAVHIEGLLEMPAEPLGLVLFAHGSGSSRHSPRNNVVVRVLRDQGMGTLLLDLLTLAEDLDYQTRFDITLLTHRLLVATRWARQHPPSARLPLGYFGASTGAAAALQAAAALGPDIRALVSRGGRADLAGTHALSQVWCPTLLLVGGRDDDATEFNRAAFARLNCSKQLSIIPGATHLFDEPGMLEHVANQAAAWFGQHLKGAVT